MKDTSKSTGKALTSDDSASDLHVDLSNVQIDLVAALKDLNQQEPPKRPNILVCGYTGSGKTTLIKAILGDVVPPVIVVITKNESTQSKTRGAFKKILIEEEGIDPERVIFTSCPEKKLGVSFARNLDKRLGLRGISFGRNHDY